MIFGKLAGAGFGYLITNSLTGALVGAFVGHLFDRGLSARLRDPALGRSGGGGFGRQASSAQAAAASSAFFEATFLVMGHVAKADGRVDEREIALAESLMDRWRLAPEQRREAIARFGDGKAAGFDLDAGLAPLLAAAPGQTALLVSFLQIQVQAAMADGDFDAAEERVLLDVAQRLGLPELVFRQIQMIARMARGGAGQAYGSGTGRGDGAGFGRGSRQGAGSGGGQGRAAGRSAPTLADAFAALGVPADSDRATTKAAWRRQISDNHPDKLVAKGLPESMIDAATERTQIIQKAWDTIREAKGWR